MTPWEIRRRSKLQDSTYRHWIPAAHGWRSGAFPCIFRPRQSKIAILCKNRHAMTKEIIMRDGFSVSMWTVAIAATTVGAAILVSATYISAQAPTSSGTVLKTPWGEPDLQGIWTDEFDTPFQRPARYGTQ